MTDKYETIIRDALAEDRRESFAPGFADRAVARWQIARNEKSVGTVIARQFAKLTPLAAAAVIALAFYNIRSNESTSAIDRLLGLTPVTAESAYDLAPVGLNAK
jgi:hypothetical protein